MLNVLFEHLVDRQFLVMLLTGVAVAATILTVAIPMFDRDTLKSRMKATALERDRIRARERARLAEAQQNKKVSVRSQPKNFMQQLVDRFNLKKALSDENTAGKLRMAGYRGQGPLIAFLFARFVAPIVLFLGAVLYLFVLTDLDHPAMLKLSACLIIAMVGFYLPNIFISNIIQKRQLSIRRAWPDALDLMLICVESGMSIEVAFKRVAHEVGAQSIPLAEELTLATAELAYLQERRQAYENLGSRTGLDSVKAVATALIQAERYGTPLAQSLRVMADESRDMRMTEAEKKAAALPPKLTVPMILFFLPVLFAVIMGPAIMQIAAM